MRNKFAVAVQWAGLAVTSTGIALWSLPAGLAVAGIGMVGFGALLEAGK